MSNCISIGRVEVRMPRPGNEYCNLCSFTQEPKDVRVLAFYTRHGQNIITLKLCQRHRLDLVLALTIAQSMEVPHVSGG